MTDNNTPEDKPKQSCSQCGDSGYIKSGVKTNLIKGNEGTLVLDNRVDVSIPCLRCNK